MTSTNRSWLSEQSGVLLIDKPRGWTSREVVDRVQDQLGGAKAGHGGTLDPIATGLLPVMVEEATKLVPYLHERDKIYRVRARLDSYSETLDIDGEVQKLSVDQPPDQDSVRQSLDEFVGTIQQVPPEFSALKVDGKRAYERRRDGESVELEPRSVWCEKLKLLNYEFPLLELEVTCGKGFYIRSLIRDLADELGTGGGIVTELNRTRYGSFSLSDACDLEAPETWELGFFRPVEVVNHLGRLECGGEQLRLLTHGSWIKREPTETGRRAAVDSEGRLHVIVEATDKRNRPEWRPVRVLKRSFRTEREPES